MARRGRMSRRRSRKVFKRGVTREHPKNHSRPTVMRGGIRL